MPQCSGSSSGVATLQADSQQWPVQPDPVSHVGEAACSCRLAIRGVCFDGSAESCLDLVDHRWSVVPAIGAAEKSGASRLLLNLAALSPDLRKTPDSVG